MSDPSLRKLSVVEDQGEYASSCGYCRRHGKTSLSHGAWAHSLTVDDYQELLNRGWRRSGKFLYKPSVEKTCCPPYTIRLKSADFAISKGQRRVLRRMRRFLEEPPHGAFGPGGDALALLAQAAQLAGKGGEAKQHRKVEVTTPGGEGSVESYKKARTSCPQNSGRSHPEGNATQHSASREDVVALVRFLEAAVEACMGAGLLPHCLAVPPIQVRPAPPRLSTQLRVGEGSSVLYTSNCAFVLAAKLSKLLRTGPAGPSSSLTNGGPHEARTGAALPQAVEAGASPAMTTATAVGSGGAEVGHEVAPFSSGTSGSRMEASVSGSAAPSAPRHQATEVVSGRGEPSTVGVRTAVDVADALAQAASSERGLPGGRRLPEGVSLQACRGHLNFVTKSPVGPPGVSEYDRARCQAKGSNARCEDVDGVGSLSVCNGLRASRSFLAADQAAVPECPGSTGSTADSCFQEPAVAPREHQPSCPPADAAGPAWARAQRTGANQQGPPSRRSSEGASVAREREAEWALEVSTAPSSFVEEEYQLYKKYQLVVHSDKPSRCTRKQYSHFLVESPLVAVPPQPGSAAPSCGFGSFHQQYRVGGCLIAVGVVDVLPLCVSSKYLFWDPDFAALSLGSLAALKEIEFVQQEGRACPSLEYYYLGYYIHTCPKMKYKAAYKPSELLCPVRFMWVPYTAAEPLLDRAAFVVLSDPSLLVEAATTQAAGPSPLVLTDRGQSQVEEQPSLSASADGTCAAGSEVDSFAPAPHTGASREEGGRLPAGGNEDAECEEVGMGEIAALEEHGHGLEQEDRDMAGADDPWDQGWEEPELQPEADGSSSLQAAERQNRPLGTGLSAAELEQQEKDVRDALGRVPLLVGGLTISCKELATLGIVPPEGLFHIRKQLTAYLELTGVTAGTRMGYRLA